METRERTTAQASMVEFNLNGAIVLCKPENIIKYQALAAKNAKIRKPAFTLGQKRRFPKWHSQMSTQQYVEEYLRINAAADHGYLDGGNKKETYRGKFGGQISIKDFLPLPCRPSPFEDPNWKDEETDEEQQTFAELAA